MPVDYTNPATLKFLTENIDKENVKRMVWFDKNREELVKCAILPEHYRGIRTEDVHKAAITEALPSFIKDFNVNIVNRRKKPTRRGTEHALSSKYKNIEQEPLMIPVEPNVKNILYERLPNGGRVEYMKARKCKKPEEKYSFCQTNSNVIGWRLKDSYFSRQAPKYGRYATFKHDVNSRSGPQPDPAYYQKPPNEPYSKCFSV